MRWIPLILVALILLLQYPLWFGKGGWFRVWQLSREVGAQKQANQQAALRNEIMDAEVRDLKQGTDAIEERARSELGMIKHDETFFQTDDALPALPASAVGMARPSGVMAAAGKPAAAKPARR